ncbi:unnamed protein product [Effrenium voratum]|nr:unnamed protein product [Effrenium voratum]
MEDACEESTCFIAGVWPVLFAWFGFTLVGLSTSCNAYRHLLNFTRPDLQPHVLRIILVGPIYAFSASLCLSMSESACFFVRSVRDIWEAVVIYSFLTLIIEYMGGEHLCLHSISQNDEAVPHLFPFSLCLPPIATGSMIRVPKMGALQFVAVKPIVAVISIVVYACGQLHNWYYQWTLFVIYNISYSVALYALYLIYWSSHEQEALQSKRPLLKFVSVKMIVFLTFWQALLLPLAPLPGSSSRWEDFILSIEMIIFGVLMNIAFTWREFSTAAPCAPRLGQGAGGCVDLMDLDAKPPGNPQDAQSGAPECKDSEGSPPSSELAGRSSLVQNAKTAFCPRDIMMDASNNFSSRYKQHVLIETAQDYELQEPEGISVDLLEAASEPRSATSLSGRLMQLRPSAMKLGRTRNREGEETTGVPSAGPAQDLGEGACEASQRRPETQAPGAGVAEAKLESGRKVGGRGSCSSGRFHYAGAWGRWILGYPKVKTTAPGQCKPELEVAVRLDDPGLSPSFLYCGLRVEPDVSDGKASSQLVEVFHMDPNQMIGCFGHPFLLAMGTAQGKEIMAALQDKLRCSSKDFRQHGCRVLMGKGDAPASDVSRLWFDLPEEVTFHCHVTESQLFDDERSPGDWCQDGTAICIERIHPAYQGRPNLQRQGNKPLTIKAA